MAAALGPRGMHRGIWALIHEHLSKGSWKRAVQCHQSQAGWVAQHIQADARRCRSPDYQRSCGMMNIKAKEILTWEMPDPKSVWPLIAGAVALP